MPEPDGAGSGPMDVEGMGAVIEATGAVADIEALAAIVALAVGTVIVGRMLGTGVVAIPMLVIAGVVTAELGAVALEVNIAVALGAMVADASGAAVIVGVNGEFPESTGSEPQPPSTTEPSTVTKIVGDMELRD